MCPVAGPTACRCSLPGSCLLHGRWLLLALCLLGMEGCRRGNRASIAVVPRTSGTILWEPENVGAQRAAAALGERIYWNASTREDDVDGQIALVERIRNGDYRGLVLAPDHSQALITPVRRALASGLPIVVVGSRLPIPASGNLGYVLNDEEEGGRLAAQRVTLLHSGHCEVAMIGINPDIAGIVERTRSFEHFLTEMNPQAHIAVRRLGTFNFGHEQEGVEEMLRANPDLNVIVAMTSPATQGALATYTGRAGGHGVKVIGFDPEALPFENPNLDSLIVQNTMRMGERAVQLIHARAEGRPFPAPEMLSPTLVTRETVNSPELQHMLYSRWQPGASDLERSSELQ